MVEQLRRFDEFVEDALYGDAGFYTIGGQKSDFTTSPETSTLFGDCVAHYLDNVWESLGCPNPFVVIEGGSGPGRLCRDILLGSLQCRDAIRYVMVERAARQRKKALAEVANSCFADVEELPITALSDLPSGPLTGVVLANELLDNLCPRLLVKQHEGWNEIYVDGSREISREAPNNASKMATALVGEVAPGVRVPLQLKAAVWIQRAINLLDRGRVLIFDYGFKTTADLIMHSQTDWLRTYKNHRRSGSYLELPGSRDITFDVAFDQLPKRAEISTQKEWLELHGIQTMVDNYRQIWEKEKAKPDSRSLAALTIIKESEMLLDPKGLGGFIVAEWQIA